MTHGLEPVRLLLSVGFSKQEDWSGLPFPSPENIPNTGIEPGSPALQADSLQSESTGNPLVDLNSIRIKYEHSFQQLH